MRRHAKASSAESNQRQATGLGRSFRGALAARDASGNAGGSGALFATTARVVLLAAIATLALASSAFAAARPYQSSFGSYAGSDPQAITVDQSNGDVYVVDTGDGTVDRYTAAGAPHKFIAGPDAGTNHLSGIGFDSGPSAAEVAVDIPDR